MLEREHPRTSRSPRTRLWRGGRLRARLCAVLAGCAAGGLLTAQGGVTVTPTTWNLGGEGGTLILSVTAPEGTPWTAASLADWLTLPGDGVMVSTLAGADLGGADGTGVSARFNMPGGVAVDAAGVAYVTDLNQRIRKVSPTGVVTTLAGSTTGFADGTGSGANFFSPTGLAVDSMGNVFVADTRNHRIRKVTPAGLVTTIAGSTEGFADGTGSAAQFAWPQGIALDPEGNVIVADPVNHRIRKVTPAGVVSTVAGSFPGDADGPAATARFYHPSGVAVGSDGTIYVADRLNYRVRAISTAGQVTTLAGSMMGGSDDGAGSAARFWSPEGIAVDAADNVFVADTGNSRVRRVTPGGQVTTVAGWDDGMVNGSGELARFRRPVALAVDHLGRIIVADTNNHRIRRIAPNQSSEVSGVGSVAVALVAAPQTTSVSRQGTVSVGGQLVTVTQAAGTPTFSIDRTSWNVSASGGETTIVLSASLDDVPWAAVSHASWLSVSPTAGTTSATLAITAAPQTAPDVRVGSVTIAGQSVVVTQAGASVFVVTPLSWNVGPGGGAQLLTVSSSLDDAVWTATSSATWLMLPPDATTVTTLAGSVFGFADGLGSASRFAHPSLGIAVDASGVLFVSDTLNSRIRRISADGLVSTLGDPTGVALHMTSPAGIALEADGSLLVAEEYGHRLRRVSPGGVVTTVAGSPMAGNADGIADAARFYAPSGVALDASGTIYVADTGNHRIRKVTPEGMVSTLAGSTEGFADGAGAAARFSHPRGLAVDASGNVFVADRNNHLIRKVTSDGMVTTFAGSTAGMGDGPAAEARFSWPSGVAFDASGDLFVADDGNHAIRRVSPDGMVSTVAGSTMGDADGSGWAASFRGPTGVAVDANGDLVVADTRNSRIRKVTRHGAHEAGGVGSGTLLLTAAPQDGPDARVATVTVAGKVVTVTQAAGVPTLTLEPSTWNVAYVGGTTTAQLTAWMLDTSWTATSSADWLTVNPTTGTESAMLTLSAAPNPSTAARLGTISVGDQTIFVAQGGFKLIDAQPTSWSVGPGGGSLTVNVSAPGGVEWSASVTEPWLRMTTGAVTVSEVTGSIAGYVDGPADVALFFNPAGVAVDASGHVYVADSGNSRIRRIEPGGLVTTWAGSDGAYFNDGPRLSAAFRSPHGLAIDASGNLYVADTFNHRIRKITPQGMVTTLAGSTEGFANGVGPAARFREPYGVAVDAVGNVYVADTGNHRVRKITQAGEVSTLAGSTAGYTDGAGLAARFNQPRGIAVDRGGHVYVADSHNSVIRQVTPSGVVTTFVGGASNPAIAPYPMGFPRDLAFDEAGWLYVVDSSRTYRVAPSGEATVITAFGVLSNSSGLAFDPSGAVVLTEAGQHNRLWRLLPDWTPISAGSGSGAVALNAAPQASVHPRTGTVLVAGEVVTVTQAGGAAQFLVGPATWGPGAGGGTTSVQLAASYPDAPWSASSSASWLVVEPASGVGSATLTLVAAPNGARKGRAATVTAGGRSVDVWQSGLLPPMATWYLAEGATGDFDMDIAIGNPHLDPVDVRITWGLPQGSPAVPPHVLTLLPTSRATVRVNDLPGLERTAVSATVESVGTPRDIVVERSMYWRHQGQTKGHNSPGVLEPATTWYLAEGATGDFNDFVLIANPSATQAALVDVTFLRDDGTTAGPLRRVVEPGQRDTVWVNLDVPGLAVASFSTRVESANGVPVIVERSMYFPSSSTEFPGPVGHQSSGVTALSTRWVFGEGVTGGVAPNPVFDTFLLLSNPGPTTANVRVVYAKDTGERFEQTVAVDPTLSMRATSRKTIWVNYEVPGFGQAAFSMEVLSDVPSLAERAIQLGRRQCRPRGGRPARRGTDEALAWAFAEGSTASLTRRARRTNRTS